MKKLLCLSLLSISAFVFADQSTSSNDSNVYLNLNTGWATMQGLPTGAWTGNFNAGYNFNRNFALEGGYNILTSSQYGSATTVTNIFDVAAKGTIPFSNLFSLYGRLGVGFGYDSWSGTANSSCGVCSAANNSYGLGLVGVGASFALSKSFDLRIENTGYIPFTNGSFNGNYMNAVTGGVQFNF
ncbi:MAG: outer membrane beta-barrel protein [Burkholderiales bacterium]|nr:outer membrane beta-barrel protein [Burkholderiales bacterium]